MSTKIIKIGLLALFLSVVGCAATQYIEIKQDLRLAEEDAIVLVGVYGIGGGWTGISSSNMSDVFTGPAFQGPGYQLPERGNEVFALRVKVGEIFRIAQVHAGNAFKVKFRNTNALDIKKSGVYYYGAIINKGNSRIIVSHKLTDEIKKDINKKYSKLLKKYKLKKQNYL